MSSVSKSAGAVPVHKSKAKAAQTRRGLLYALPDWLMIIVLFFVPIVLLVVMACSRWSLLGGNRGVNFPDNFVKVFENKLFWPSIWFTLEYTVIVTIFLLVLGLGMAMIVQESSKWNNVLRTCFLLPSATGLASASLLFYALYSPQVGPVQDSELVGPDAGGWFGAGHRPVGPVGHDYRDCLAFLGLLHAADDDRSAGYPR